MIVKFAQTHDCKPEAWNIHCGFDRIEHIVVALPGIGGPFAPDFQCTPEKPPVPSTEGEALLEERAVFIDAYRPNVEAPVKFLISTEAYITNDNGDTLEVLNR